MGQTLKEFLALQHRCRNVTQKAIIRKQDTIFHHPPAYAEAASRRQARPKKQGTRSRPAWLAGSTLREMFSWRKSVEDPAECAGEVPILHELPGLRPRQVIQYGRFLSVGHPFDELRAVSGVERLPDRQKILSLCTLCLSGESK